MKPSDARHKESLRQQMLVRTLLRDSSPELLQGWMRDPPARVGRALEAYVANAGANAERALSASFPVTRALVGEQSFAQLARAFWHARPPARGDLAWLGAALPAFIGAAEQLADEPYLADCARLEWLLTRAELAVNAEPQPQTLALLAQADPAHVRIELLPGTAVIASTHPIVTIWQAHQRDEHQPNRFATVRAAFEAGAGESAWVWRDGWRARVAQIDTHTCAFMGALIDGRSLGDALAAAGETFDFQGWLVVAIERGSLRGACSLLRTTETPS